MSKKLSVLAVIALSLMLGMSNACAERAAKPAEETAPMNCLTCSAKLWKGLRHLMLKR